MSHTLHTTQNNTGHFSHDDVALLCALGNPSIIKQVLGELREDKEKGAITQKEYDDAVVGIEEAHEEMQHTAKVFSSELRDRLKK